MAKPKYEIGTVLCGEVTGTLDYSEETMNKVIIVDGEEHDLEEFTNLIMGAEVQIKFNKAIEDEE